MSGPARGHLLLAECPACGRRFIARPGGCPRCGHLPVRPRSVEAWATVRAATEAQVTSGGFAAPHRIALVELEGGVRTVVVISGPLPRPGTRIQVERDGALYRSVEPAPAGPDGAH